MVEQGIGLSAVREPEVTVVESLRFFVPKRLSVMFPEKVLVPEPPRSPIVWRPDPPATTVTDSAMVVPPLESEMSSLFSFQRKLP